MREQLTLYTEDGEPVVVPSRLVICSQCEGEGKVDNPAFSNGITSSEWNEWDYEDRERYLSGAYDVSCERCYGRGMERVPDPARMTFGQKRLVVLKRRDDAESRECDRIQEMERRFGA